MPVARTGNKIVFVFIKEDMLLGQKLSDKKTVFAVNILFLLPSQISYRKGIFRLAPSKFLSLLQPFGYTKDEYLFIVETVEKMPEKFATYWKYLGRDLSKDELKQLMKYPQTRETIDRQIKQLNNCIERRRFIDFWYKWIFRRPATTQEIDQHCHWRTPAYRLVSWLLKNKKK